jgi:DNA repair protein RadD
MEAVHEYLCSREGNPLVVLPTGAGKTPTMAWMIQQYMREYPYLRVLVLAHIRELLTQGVEKMREIWPAAPVGVYSAGLRSKDRRAAITYAGIQSIWRKAAKFDPWDLIFVDEAHRIPVAGETTYRHFLGQAKECNPNLRIVGWTATPFRLDGGHIAGRGRLFDDIVYEANVKDLISAGYLCPLKSKAGAATVDVGGVHVRKGEFVTSELMDRVADVVRPATNEAVRRMDGRKAIIFFCVTVEHAKQVSGYLAEHSITAPVIHAKTPPRERRDVIAQFTRGDLRTVVNVNVLSEGFDARRIDCVVLMRPTASAGLFYQQVGRGLRLHQDKNDCLVLDFAGNTLRHGPIDLIRPRNRSARGGEIGESPAKSCPECDELIHAGLRECPACGFQFPPPPIAHAAVPHDAPIISDGAPWEVEVRDVSVREHRKAGKPPSLLVTYFGAYESHKEWVCFEHGSFATARAKQWWARRFGDPVPATTAEALNRLFLAANLRAITKSITVRKTGKYTEVVNVKLRDEIPAVAH